MLRDIIEEFSLFIVFLSVMLIAAAIIYLGWYIFLVLLLLGVCGGAIYICYRIVEIWNEAHKMHK